MLRLRNHRLGRCLAALLVLIAAPAMLCAQEEEPPAKPKMEIAEPTFEFGSVSQGTVVEHNFELQNSGQGDLVLQRLVAACGCTASNASSDVIKPGETATIHVKFDTAGFSGEKLKTVRVYTNDADQPSVLLSMKGVVEPDVSVKPQRVYFGNVSRGSLGSEEGKVVEVSVRDGADVTIAGVKTYSKKLIVEEIESGERRRKFRVSIDDEAALGELRDRIVVSLKGGMKRSINVPVFASVRGALRFDPSSVAFGILEGEEKLVKHVKLENRGKKSVSVKGVKSSHPAVEASLKEIKPGRSYVLQVSVDPKAVKKNLRASLLIDTTSEDQEQLSLSVYGILPPQS